MLVVESIDATFGSLAAARTGKADLGDRSVRIVLVSMNLTTQ
jgi:hypothetical protein